ncbi:MAG: YbjN domain-containing protein [Desertifilum sp. SIO1I2]|nr:YbjN domain-containing protein [Desertifilum sp. SIO1I2]
MTSNIQNPTSSEAEARSAAAAATEEAMQEIATMNCPEEIEAVIAGLATDQKVKVGQNQEGAYLWQFCYGSVEVFVKLTGETDDDTLTVWSYVLKLPAKNQAELMQKLLEKNWLSTFEAQFAIVDNQIVVLTNRTIEGLSPAEISRAITLVATIADEHDDVLQAEHSY